MQHILMMVRVCEVLYLTNFTVMQTEQVDPVFLALLTYFKRT